MCDSLGHNNRNTTGQNAFYWDSVELMHNKWQNFVLFYLLTHTHNIAQYFVNISKNCDKSWLVCHCKRSKKTKGCGRFWKVKWSWIYICICVCVYACDWMHTFLENWYVTILIVLIFGVGRTKSRTLGIQRKFNGITPTIKSVFICMHVWVYSHSWLLHCNRQAGDPMQGLARLRQPNSYQLY